MIYLVFAAGLVIGALAMMFWLATGPTVKINLTINSDPDVLEVTHG